MLSVIDETADFLVVDKPQGLVCHPSKQGPESSLIGRARLALGAEAFLVNRLDRETGGIVLIARRADVARDLGHAFAAGAVEKRYLGLVHGRLDRQPFVIDAPLGKDLASTVAIKDAVRADGAPARTEVTPLEHLTGPAGPMTFVALRPETGRKHQIRIHLAHVGHPIVGDKIYGADETRYLRFVTGALTDGDREALVLEHHALHAAELALTWRGRRFTWTSPPAAAMTGLLKTEAV